MKLNFSSTEFYVSKGNLMNGEVRYAFTMRMKNREFTKPRSQKFYEEIFYVYEG